MDSPFPHQIALMIVAGTIYVGLFLYDSYDPLNYYYEGRLVWVFFTIFMGIGVLFFIAFVVAIVLSSIVFAGILIPPQNINTNVAYIDSVLKFPILIKLAESYAWSRRRKRGAEGQQRFRPLLDLIIIALLYYAAMAVVWFIAILFGMPLGEENPGITVFWFPRLFPSNLINGSVCALLVLLIVSITRKPIRGVDSPVFLTIKDLIRSALSIESEDPRRALELYHRAKKKNQEFNWLVFAVSLLAPVLAGIQAFNTMQITGWQGILLRIAIISYLGFGFPVMVRGLSDNRGGVRSLFTPSEGSFYSLGEVLFIGPFFMGQQLLIALKAALLSFAVMAPFLGLILLCSDLQCKLIDQPYDFFTLKAIPLTVGLVALLVVLADISYDDLWPPFTGARILFAGLRDNISEVLEYFSTWTAGIILVSLELKSSPILSNSLIIEGILSGVFLALALSQASISNQFTAFIQLGLIRCQIRLQNWGSAKILLIRISTKNTCEFLGREDAKSICEYLSGHLHFVVDGIIKGYKSRFLKENIDSAAEMFNNMLPDKEIWNQNISANRLLVESKEVQDSMERSVKRPRLEKLFDLENLPIVFFVLYWVAGIISFLLWMSARL